VNQASVADRLVRARFPADGYRDGQQDRGILIGSQPASGEEGGTVGGAGHRVSAIDASKSHETMSSVFRHHSCHLPYSS
jgi:hypothetical protein